MEFAPFERRAETSWDNDPEPGKRTLAAMRAGVQHLEVAPRLAQHCVHVNQRGYR